MIIPITPHILSGLPIQYKWWTLPSCNWKICPSYHSCYCLSVWSCCLPSKNYCCSSWCYPKILRTASWNEFCLGLWKKLRKNTYLRAPREMFPVDSNLVCSWDFLLSSDPWEWAVEFPLEEWKLDIPLAA